MIVDDSPAPRLEFAGQHVSVSARFQFPRSVQGRPAIIQAGGSPQGIELAAKHADAVFCQANTIPAGQEFYRTLKDRAAAHGRSPDEILVLPGLNVTLGSTEAEAAARRAELSTILQTLAECHRSGDERTCGLSAMMALPLAG